MQSFRSSWPRLLGLLAWAAATGLGESGKAPLLDNGLVSVVWEAAGGRPGFAILEGGTHHSLFLPGSDVWVALDGDRKLRLQPLAWSARPVRTALAAGTGTRRLSEREAGQALAVCSGGPASGLGMQWRAELRTGSDYVRLVLRVSNAGATGVTVGEIGLVDQDLPGAARSGPASGGMIVDQGIFLGIEHPLARNESDGGRVRCRMPLHRLLRPGESVEVAEVVGFAAAGQLRRSVLRYLERERPRPYRPFLHYNSWYSIGYFNPYTEGDLLGIIGAFNDHLARARGVALEGYVLDDGWDAPDSLWNFGPGFPEGLERVGALARQSGASLGIWLSPWGGYGEPKQRRLAMGSAAGFETREGSFALSGPRYYQRFRDRCLALLRKGHVAYFKFDGIGAKGGPERLDPASRRDFEALDRLIDELRAISPDLFINETTGTWPSPFWLLNVDSIWRGGEDHAFQGEGNSRERWITYRDAQTYARVVVQSPLFPLNSLMLHGVIFASKAEQLSSAAPEDFEHEVWSYFGTGTQLQELYVSPNLLSERNWDDLAAAVRWSRANREILEDSHWIGGDPSRGEVYGWAAWAPERGLVVLRNPSARPAGFTLDPGSAFELPAGACRRFSLRISRPSGAPPPPALEAGRGTLIALAPFEVRVMEALPQARVCVR